MRPSRQGAAAPAGFTLVELLVGLALGLLVLAAALTLLAQQTHEQRALLVEARLMQDLRSAADLVARDLRRAGHWADAGAGTWRADAAPAANPYAALAPAAAASDAAAYAYSRDAVENHVLDGNERFGLRLRNRAIELQLGAGNWQTLTDAGVIEITALEIAPVAQSIELGALCPQACPADSATCPPRLQLRSRALSITARATADPAVQRSLVARVRLRNDAIDGDCTA